MLYAQGKKGTDISIYSITNLHEYHTLDISPHNLHLFQALYQQKETIKGYLIGVEPYEISFHIGLSKRLDEKWNQIVQRVKRTIEGLIEGRNER